MSREQEEGGTRERRSRIDRTRPETAERPETEITADQEDLSQIAVDEVSIKINGLDVNEKIQGFVSMAFPVDDAADLQRLNAFMVQQIQFGQMNPDNMIESNISEEIPNLSPNEDESSNGMNNLTVIGMNEGEQVVKMETNIPEREVGADSDMGRNRYRLPDPDNNPQP